MGDNSVLDTSSSLGAALRATRQKLGRSVQDLANATRIKRHYLEAIEEMRIEELPSRPFTIGYVRAYARALGLDGELAVQRFKQDAPSDGEPLREPVGVRKHRDVRLLLLVGGGAIVIIAIGLWNLAQHAMRDDGPAPAAVVEPAAQSAAPASGTGAALPISAATPAPQESTLPAPYLTPGMIPDDGAEAKAKPPIDPSAPVRFLPHGEIFGAPATASSVILQAKKSVTLVVRGANGNVYFAQQLKPGEAYRPPMLEGLAFEVTDPDAVHVYISGQIRPGLNPAPSGLTASVTSLNQILKTAPPPPAPPAAAPTQASAPATTPPPAATPAASATPAN